MDIDFHVEGSFHFGLEEYIEGDRLLYLATIHQPSPEPAYRVEVICGIVGY